MATGFRRTFWLVTLASAFALLAIGSCVASDSAARWIVVYKDAGASAMALQKTGVKAHRSYGIIPGYAADLTDAQVTALKSDPSVAYVEPDAVRHALQYNAYSTADYAQAYTTTAAQIVPYGVTIVRAPQVWPYTKGSGVKVAHLDTGVDLTHPDLANVISSATFTSSPVQDTDGHGTHTSGTIAAPGKSGGVVGVAPEAGLLVAQVFDSSGNAYDSDIIAGIDWAVRNGANVISMSLGGSTYDSALNDACANAVANGVVVVAAAGNDGTNSPSYPAAYPSVISVAAVNQAKQRASFSSYGSTVDLCAPGVGVTSAVRVGTGWLTSANWNGVEHETGTMDGSANGTVAGPVVYCGLGSPAEIPSSVRGKIAHIRRGTLTFEEKVNNAVAAGAIGVIVSNNTTDVLEGTLGGSSSTVVVAVSQANGDELQANDGTTVTITNTNPADYGEMDGTSMATPHVAGVAALMFGARHGHVTPSEIRTALQNSAEDLGSSGRDDYYGYGLVNAYGALGKLIPVVQSASASPTSVAPGASVGVTVQLTTTTGLSSVTANGVFLTVSGTTSSGTISADATAGTHTVDVVVTDTYGNVTHNTSASYTTDKTNPPTVSISAPSSSSTYGAPVSYTVTYTNASAVTLSGSNVALNASGSASGAIAVTGSGASTRTVTVSNISGSGALGISIAAGTASNSGGSSAAAGPSATFVVSKPSVSVAVSFPTSGASCARNRPELSIAGTASGSNAIATVTWVLNNATSGTCTGTTSWTASGLTLLPGANTLMVTATDTYANTATASMTVTYTDSSPGDAWQGNAMVSLPIIPDATDPSPVVGFDTDKWFTYIASATSYVRYPNQQSWFLPATSAPGRGFWAGFGTQGGGSPAGNIPSQTQPKTIHLYAGWNLIGDPFISNVPWSLTAIAVRKTGTTDAIALGSSQGTVQSHAWGWDPIGKSYYKIVDPSDDPTQVNALQPWRGYWLRAYAECDLILPAP